MASHGNSLQETGEASAEDLRYSRELAQQLVRHLGIKGATRTCIENHWQGVLAVVRTMNAKP